jgi:Skp family chaperone for outer membrane proteins
MNHTQALARARKILGPRAAIRESPHALRAEARALERQRANDLRARQRELKEKLDALREKLLMDPDYVQLREEYTATREAAELAASRSHCEPIRVGRISDPLGFFHVEATGDTLAEAVADLETKRGK